MAAASFASTHAIGRHAAPEQRHTTSTHPSAAGSTQHPTRHPGSAGAGARAEDGKRSTAGERARRLQHPERQPAHKQQAARAAAGAGKRRRAGPKVYARRGRLRLKCCSCFYSIKADPRYPVQTLPPSGGGSELRSGDAGSFGRLMPDVRA